MDERVENIMRGFGEGTVYGASRFLNGATLGGADYLDSLTGGHIGRLGEELGGYAAGEGLSDVWNGLNYTLEGMGSLGAGLFGNGLNNAFWRYNGRRNLINQLNRGLDFRDVYFGKIDPIRQRELNQLRKGLRQPVIGSPRVTIPADQVEHIYQRRVLDNGYKPEEVAETLSEALFGRKVNIYPDKNYDTLQHFVNTGQKPAREAIVGKIRGGDNIFIKTGFKNEKGVK